MKGEKTQCCNEEENEISIDFLFDQLSWYPKKTIYNITENFYINGELNVNAYDLTNLSGLIEDGQVVFKDSRKILLRDPTKHLRSFMKEDVKLVIWKWENSNTYIANIIYETGNIIISAKLI